MEYIDLTITTQRIKEQGSLQQLSRTLSLPPSVHMCTLSPVTDPRFVLEFDAAPHHDSLVHTPNWHLIVPHLQELRVDSEPTITALQHWSFSSHKLGHGPPSLHDHNSISLDDSCQVKYGYGATGSAARRHLYCNRSRLCARTHLPSKSDKRPETTGHLRLRPSCEDLEKLPETKCRYAHVQK